jgi:hypothetical protein
MLSRKRRRTLATRCIMASLNGLEFSFRAAYRRCGPEALMRVNVPVSGEGPPPQNDARIQFDAEAYA